MPCWLPWLRRSATAPSAEPAFDAADFAKKAAHLAAMAAAFGYDASKARLVREEFAFELGGVRCKAEGRALPDGAILVFYDPEMTLARLACCVAHEVQHQKYACVRRLSRPRTRKVRCTGLSPPSRRSVWPSGEGFPTIPTSIGRAGARTIRRACSRMR